MAANSAAGASRMGWWELHGGTSIATCGACEPQSPAARPRRTHGAAEFECLAGARGTIYVTHLAPGCLLLTEFGYDDGEVNDRLYAAIEAAIAQHGGVTVFLDARAQTGVAASSRDRAAVWLKTNKPKVRGSHLLFRSKLLELAIALANLTSGGVTKGYTNVAEFERVIAKHVPGFTRLPAYEDPHTRPAARTAT